jgi:hypothetical protein
MEDRLTAFLEKYPDPVAFANAMGAGPTTKETGVLDYSDLK